jgi:hypothetical protein|tara:strand:- start:1718 stop:1972 length:255 start_codon:yes stop_codon:yes gene_type:complete
MIMAPQEQDEFTGYSLSWVPLKFDKVCREILFFGYPLFGAWLPYIGFVTFFNERDEPIRTFIFEWFLRGWIIHRSSEKEDWYDE